MSLPEIKPKVENLEHTTTQLEADMRDVRDRLTKVETTAQNTEKKVDDIHKWFGWMFKTIVGAIISIVVAVIIAMLV